MLGQELGFRKHDQNVKDFLSERYFFISFLSGTGNVTWTLGIYTTTTTTTTIISERQIQTVPISNAMEIWCTRDARQFRYRARWITRNISAEICLETTHGMISAVVFSRYIRLTGSHCGVNCKCQCVSTCPLSLRWLLRWSSLLRSVKPCSELGLALELVIYQHGHECEGWKWGKRPRQLRKSC